MVISLLQQLLDMQNIAIAIHVAIFFNGFLVNVLDATVVVEDATVNDACDVNGSVEGEYLV